jgi:hypothetical protein
MRAGVLHQDQLQRHINIRCIKYSISYFIHKKYYIIHIIYIMYFIYRRLPACGCSAPGPASAPPAPPHLPCTPRCCRCRRRRRRRRPATRPPPAGPAGAEPGGGGALVSSNTGPNDRSERQAQPVETTTAQLAERERIRQQRCGSGVVGGGRGGGAGGDLGVPLELLPHEGLELRRAQPAAGGAQRAAARHAVVVRVGQVDPRRDVLPPPMGAAYEKTKCNDDVRDVVVAHKITKCGHTGDCETDVVTRDPLHCTDTSSRVPVRVSGPLSSVGTVQCLRCRNSVGPTL